MVIQIVTNTKQENQANAKVSAQQQSVYMKAPSEDESTQEHVEKYTQYVTTLSLTLRVDLHFYRAMHLSAKRGIAIACRLSVRPSVRPSVRL